MRRLVLAAVAALAAAAPAHARVAHDPCPGPGAWADGQRINRWNVDPHVHRYRTCGDIEKVPRGRIVPVHGAHCGPGFELRGTSGYADAHQAKWDFWAENGSWVTWTGWGDWSWHRDSSGAQVVTGYTPHLHNWNVSHDWPARVFADCVRAYVPNP